MTRPAIFLLILCAVCRAQSPASDQSPVNPDQPVTTLKVTTRVVDISAVVTSKGGETQGGMTKDDFILFEDGKEKPIRYFTQGSDLPLTLALLIDTSSSQRTFVGDESQAGMVFVESMLQRPDDRATIVRFDNTISQIGTLTHSLGALRMGLSSLSASPTSRAGGGGTLLNDAISATAKGILAAQTGRKAMVILTDGCDFGSRNTEAQAIEQAERAEAQIFSVLYSTYTGGNNSNGFSCDGLTRGMGNPGLHVLQDLSNSTGGRVFSVTENLPLREIFTEIGQQLRLEYELGYTPSAEIKPNSYHKLELKMKDKKLAVQARKGYFAPP
jgi:Ca-activated chloride channel homolog